MIESIGIPHPEIEIILVNGASVGFDYRPAGGEQIAIGDLVTLLDREATVVGLSEETTFWAGSIAFARAATLESLLRSPGLRSFLLVSPAQAITYSGPCAPSRTRGVSRSSFTLPPRSMTPVTNNSASSEINPEQVVTLEVSRGS